jgi:hypothetical protein
VRAERRASKDGQFSRQHDPQSLQFTVEGAIMDQFKGILDGVATIFQIVASTKPTATLSIIGLTLLVLAGLLSYWAIRSEPNQTPTWMRVLLFGSLVGGLLFSAAGPGLALFQFSQAPLRKISPQTAFTNLQENKEVRWLVRLVSYDQQTDPQLAADKLFRLGPEKQQFSFVSAYEDLAGYSAEDSIQMTGGTLDPGQHISAVIFPLRTQLYPANARGLLQVIQQVENRKDVEIQKPFLKGSNLLSKDELDDLNDHSIVSYRIDNFQDKYHHYCELAQQFRCDETYSAREYIGGLYPDWHPLGFSLRHPNKNPCHQQPTNYCTFSDWNSAKSSFLPGFGSRAFVVRNLLVNTIAGRMLVDFEQPAHQIIPFIFEAPKAD